MGPNSSPENDPQQDPSRPPSMSRAELADWLAGSVVRYVESVEDGFVAARLYALCARGFTLACREDLALSLTERFDGLTYTSPLEQAYILDAEAKIFIFCAAAALHKGQPHKAEALLNAAIEHVARIPLASSTECEEEHAPPTTERAFEILPAVLLFEGFEKEAAAFRESIYNRLPHKPLASKWEPSGGKELSEQEWFERVEAIRASVNAISPERDLVIELAFAGRQAWQNGFKAPAVKAVRDAFHFARWTTDPNDQTNMLINIAPVAIRIGEYDVAVECFRADRAHKFSTSPEEFSLFDRDSGIAAALILKGPRELFEEHVKKVQLESKNPVTKSVHSAFVEIGLRIGAIEYLQRVDQIREFEKIGAPALGLITALQHDKRLSDSEKDLVNALILRVVAIEPFVAAYSALCVRLVEHMDLDTDVVHKAKLKLALTLAESGNLELGRRVVDAADISGSTLLEEVIDSTDKASLEPTHARIYSLRARFEEYYFKATTFHALNMEVEARRYFQKVMETLESSEVLAKNVSKDDRWLAHGDFENHSLSAFSLAFKFGDFEAVRSILEKTKAFFHPSYVEPAMGSEESDSAALYSDAERRHHQLFLGTPVRLVRDMVELICLAEDENPTNEARQTIQIRCRAFM